MPNNAPDLVIITGRISNTITDYQKDFLDFNRCRLQGRLKDGCMFRIIPAHAMKQLVSGLRVKEAIFSHHVPSQHEIDFLLNREIKVRYK